MRFLKLFISIFFVLPHISAAAHTSLPDTLNFDADPYFLLTEEADSAISKRAWAEAAARLNDALNVRPDDPTAPLLLSNLAAVYTYMESDSLALATYDEVLARAPRMLTPRLGRAKLMLQLGRDLDAYMDFSRAIEIDSLCYDARYYRGMMALYSGGCEQAEGDFKVLADIAPKALDTAIALSALYSLTGRDREAIPYLQRLIEDDPAPEYYASLAGCYLELGELSDASEVIANGLKLYPRDAELYYYRAWLNRDRYRLDEAERDGKLAVELGASKVRVDDLLRHRGPAAKKLPAEE